MAESTPTDAAMEPCGDCGMPCAQGEYHPYAACLMFKACHNSETVRANLNAVRAQPAPAASQKQQAAAGEPECTCSANNMPFGTCCKVRSAFERWYDEQRDGRLQPFDVFKGGWIERHKLSGTPQPTHAQAQHATGAKSFQTYAEANAYSKGYYAGKKAATQAQAGAVPLTDEQIDELIAARHFRKDYELKASDKVCINWYRMGLRDGEQAHGIKET